MSSKNCKKLKRQFDTSLNIYVTDIINYCNITFSTNDLKKNNYKHLSTIIKNSGYSINLGNMLIQIKQTGNEECLEDILNEYYVHFMRPAYREYMNMQNEFIDFHISFEIILRLVKDSLFGQFQFGTKKNLSFLLKQRELGVNVKNKIKKSINYDCRESFEFLLDFVQKNTFKNIRYIYSNKRDNKKVIILLDIHIKNILDNKCLNILLNIPDLKKVIDEYNENSFLYDNDGLLILLKKNLNKELK